MQEDFMKKKTTLLSLVLALSLVLGSFQMVFAGDEITSTTIKKNDIKTEADLDDLLYSVYSDVTGNGYKLIGSEKLMTWVNAKKDMVVVDTMPEKSSYNVNHIPDAICSEAGDNGPNGQFTAAQQTALLNKVSALCKKTVTKEVKTTKKIKKYWHSKKKKWVTKKPPKKYWKKNKKTGKKTKTVKKTTTKQVTETIVDKNKTVVVYCGFVGCNRSHEAAKYLAKNGFKNVYRYAGGINAWKNYAESDPDHYKVESVKTE
jgi:rhodanese-related sulfurtransferase